VLCADKLHGAARMRRLMSLWRAWNRIGYRCEFDNVGCLLRERVPLAEREGYNFRENSGVLLLWRTSLKSGITMLCSSFRLDRSRTNTV
jgi:hypothetical protein